MKKLSLSRPRSMLATTVLVVLAGLLVSCGGLALSIANAPALVGPFDRFAGLAYGEGPRRRLDVYQPHSARAGRAGAPVVVFWYGGAWQRGSKSQYRFVGAALAESGFVAVLPDYRLYPQVRFPEFIDDGAAALRWVTQHAADYGGDPQKIFLMGHSAGAHLAASLALDPTRLTRAGVDPAQIRGLIGLSGPYELAPNTAVLNRIFAAPYGPADWQPLRLAGRDSPPALLLHGGDDSLVLPRNAEKLAAALTAAGVAARAVIYPGKGHADTVAALSVPARGRAPVLEAVRAFVSERSGLSLPPARR